MSGCITQRVSTPCAPPSSGVNSRPSGGRGACAAPASAARCSRRTGVRAGNPGISVTTKGTAPLRSASSIDHKRSSARCGATKINRPGSTKRSMPSGFSLSVPYAGAIHSTGPLVRAASISAKTRRARPAHSWTRPRSRSISCRTVSAGRLGEWFRVKRVVCMTHTIECSLFVLNSI